MRGFIENLTEDNLRALREAVELQEFYLNKSDLDHIRAQDTRFHELIYQRCGSAILCDTLSPLHKKVQKFRRISIEQPERAQRSVREHREIYNAIAARDADLAEKLMNEHVGHAMSAIMDKGM